LTSVFVPQINRQTFLQCCWQPQCLQKWRPAWLLETKPTEAIKRAAAKALICISPSLPTDD
jgi:hypothetical protein